MPIRMKPFLRALWMGVACVLLLGMGRAPVQAQPSDVLITGGWLFDSPEEAIVRNPGVLVRAGRIQRVGVDPAEFDTAAARVVTLADDEYLLPGFIDMHAHYAMDLFGEGRVEEREAYPILFLANGVTSTFTAGEMEPEAMRELRFAIEAGNEIGPRIYNAGPYFGTARPGWNPDMSVEQLRDEIDYWAEQGVRGIKVKRIGPRLLAPLIERAHQHGLTVTGHLGSGYGNTVNPRDAITMGIDRIEHFMGGDALPDSVSAYDSLVDAEPGTPAFDRIAQHFIDHQVHFDATITAYGYFGAQEPAVFEDFANARQYLTPYMREIIAEREGSRSSASRRFTTSSTAASRRFTTRAAVTSSPSAPTTPAGASSSRLSVSIASCTRSCEPASPRGPRSRSPRSTAPTRWATATTSAASRPASGPIWSSFRAIRWRISATRATCSGR